MANKVLKPSFWYWERLSESGPDRVGTVVVIGWLMSKRRHINPYIRFYQSCGWDCLVCHAHVLNVFFPTRAAALGMNLLNELEKDLHERVRPIVFAVFSGGHKSSFYKIIQILQGKCAEMQFDPGSLDSVRKCSVGVIFDSSPMDFVSAMGIRFVIQQWVASTSGRSKPVLIWGAHAFGKSLDLLFYSRFQHERFDLWHTMYSLVNIGPILFLCSNNDDLAPTETIFQFATDLRELGGDSTVMCWEVSEHVGHFRLHTKDYKDAVRKLLKGAVSTYCERLQSPNEVAAVNKDVVLSPPYARNLPTVSDSCVTSWVDLPEATAARIVQLSKIRHFFGLNQKEALNDEPFNHSASCQRLELRSNSEAENNLSILGVEDKFSEKNDSLRSRL